MNRDDLLKMLDLTGKEPPAEEATDLDVTTVGPGRKECTSPTALELDEWALRRGREVLDDSERLRALGLDEHTIADFHASAFLPDPRLLPDCADSSRRAFLEELFQTPEFQALHATTMLRDVASTIAATSFAEQFARLREEEKPRAGKDATGREMATLRAVGRALTAATREVEEAADAASALGLGPGSPGGNDAGVIASLYRRVRNDPSLRKICPLAGRYRRVAQSRQRQKASHGMDDVLGVTLDGDLSRLLPLELARLAMPELELDTLRRLAERQCMAREYHATEPVAKGPVVVVVDESGSMEGEKVHTAKAMALALAWVARQQKRWCAVCAYSGDSGERLLALPPGRWDEQKLADWLCAFIGRGSSMDVPVREMPDFYRRLNAPAGKTDLIFVTDALARIPLEVQQAFVAWKRQVKARLITLVIGSSAGDLGAVSEECHEVRSLALTEEAVERVLSL